MLLSNYGRDQGDSSFEESSQAQPVVLHHHHQQQQHSHHHHHHQPQPPPLTSADTFPKPNLSSPSSSAEQMLACQRPSSAQQQQEQQRRLKPQSDQVLKCPRCESMNTKFCYYNNYSLTQPRHFCKSCKRYWTKGGALRNVPVGGGCRKNKRVKQRPQEHAHQQATSTTTEDTNGAGVTASSAATSGLDGASSSTILQQEYPATSSSSGLYDVQKASSSLPFERAADHVSRMFSSGPSPPISIHWAGQMALSSQQHQTYDAAASMLGLNMPGSIKQEAGVHSGPELASMFDPSSLAGVAAATAAATHVHGVSEGLSSFHHVPVPMENYGLAGEVLWRFPQPKLVSLLEEGGEPEAAASRHGLLDLEVAAAAAASRPAAAAAVEKLKPSKATISCKEVPSSEYEQQQGDSSSQEWQPPAGDGFFEGNGGDTSAYWGNAGGWSSELQYGGGAPASGAQLM